MYEHFNNRLTQDLPKQQKAFPSWLHRKLPKGGNLWATAKSVKGLATVCEEAKCPNRFECWSQKTATFLAMGKSCTRACPFCDIAFSKSPPPLDPEEPDKIARATRELNLKHIVVTMVARDDYPDGGALQMTKIVSAIRKQSVSTRIELLCSDFAGNPQAWELIAASQPEVFNHNIETVESLSPSVRHRATYRRSLDFLSYMAKRGTMRIKSGLMLGLGEQKEEVYQSLRDLQEIGCEIVTIGQYLRAGPKKLRVKSFIHPDLFAEYEVYGRSLGLHMFCGPFVRSSYRAADIWEKK